MYRLLWKLLKKQHLVSLLKNLCRNPQVGRIGSSTCGFATGDGWYPSHRSTRGRVVPSSADFGLVLFVCAVYCSHCHLNFLIIMILMCVYVFLLFFSTTIYSLSSSWCWSSDVSSFSFLERQKSMRPWSSQHHSSWVWWMWRKASVTWVAHVFLKRKVLGGLSVLWLPGNQVDHPATSTYCNHVGYRL